MPGGPHHGHQGCHGQCCLRRLPHGRHRRNPYEVHGASSAADSALRGHGSTRLARLPTIPIARVFHNCLIGRLFDAGITPCPAVPSGPTTRSSEPAGEGGLVAAHPSTCTLKATPQTCMGAVLVRTCIVSKALFIPNRWHRTGAGGGGVVVGDNASVHSSLAVLFRASLWRQRGHHPNFLEGVA